MSMSSPEPLNEERSPRAIASSHQDIRFSDRAVILTIPAGDPCELILSHLPADSMEGNLTWGGVSVNKEKLFMGMCGYLKTELTDWANAKFEEITQFEAGKQQFESSVEAAKREIMNHFLSWVAEVAYAQLLPEEQARFNLSDPALRHQLAVAWLDKPENEINTYVLVFLERRSGALAHLFRDYTSGSSAQIYGELKDLYEDAKKKLDRFLSVSYEVEELDAPYAEALEKFGLSEEWVEQFQAYEHQIRSLDNAYSVVEAAQITVAAFQTDKPREKIDGLFNLMSLLGETAGDSKIPIVSFFGDVVEAYAKVAQEMLKQVNLLEGKIREREGYCVGLAAHAMSDDRDQAFRSQFGESIRACPESLTVRPFKDIYLQAQPDNADQLYFWVEDSFVEGQPRGGGLDGVRQVMRLIADASVLPAFTRFSEGATDLSIVSAIYNTRYEGEDGFGIPGLVKESSRAVDGIIERLAALTGGLDPYGAHACRSDVLYDYLGTRIEGRIPSLDELWEKRDEFVTRYAMRYILAQHRGLGTSGPTTLTQLWSELENLSLLQVRGSVRGSGTLAEQRAISGAVLHITTSQAEQFPGCEVDRVDDHGRFVVHLLTSSPDYSIDIHASVDGESGPVARLDRGVVSGTDTVPFVRVFDGLLLEVPVDEEEPLTDESLSGCEDARSRVDTVRSALDIIESQLETAGAGMGSMERIGEQAANAERHQQQAEKSSLQVIEAKQQAEDLSFEICANAELIMHGPPAEEARAMFNEAKRVYRSFEALVSTSELAAGNAVVEAGKAEEIFAGHKGLGPDAELLGRLQGDLDAVKPALDAAEAVLAAAAENGVIDDCHQAVRATTNSIAQRLAAAENRIEQLRAATESLPDSAYLEQQVAAIKLAAAEARAAADTAEIYLEALKQLQSQAARCLQSATAAIPDKVRVPAVEDLDLDAAKNILATAGLGFDLVAGPPAETEEDEGTIDSQDPAAGVEAEAGTTVALAVRGPFGTLVTIPDVQDRVLDDARGILKAAGFQCSLSAGPAARTLEEEGTVESQHPGPGDAAKKDTVVTLRIRGPMTSLVPVPDVMDYQLDDARGMLEAAELGSNLAAGPPAPTAETVGTIKSQHPLPGELVKKGTAVALTVRGPVDSVVIEEEETDNERIVPPPVPGQRRWVLVRTVPNPYNKQMEKRDRSSSSDMQIKKTASANAISLAISTYLFWSRTRTEHPEDVVFRADFVQPPPVLVPGQTVTLQASVTGRGRAKTSTAHFWLSVILGDEVLLARTDYKIDRSLIPRNVSLQFTVPETSGQTLRIIALFSWTDGARVHWDYQAQ